MANWASLVGAVVGVVSVAVVVWGVPAAKRAAEDARAAAVSLGVALEIDSLIDIAMDADLRLQRSDIAAAYNSVARLRVGLARLRGKSHVPIGQDDIERLRGYGNDLGSLEAELISGDHATRRMVLSDLRDFLAELAEQLRSSQEG